MLALLSLSLHAPLPARSRSARVMWPSRARAAHASCPPVVPPLPSSVEGWRTFAASVGMRLGEAFAFPAPPPPPHAQLEALRASMSSDGYVVLPEVCQEELSLCAGAIDRLEEAGLPPQFLLLFDETWKVVDRATSALSSAFRLANVQDFFIFNVKPGMTGWGMHRDRAGPASSRAFTEQGLPLYTTVWVALTDASVQTSCIYLLPASADPAYRDPQSEPAEDPEIVLRQHQYVRAIPANRGTVLSWSQRVIHWGSASPPGAPSSRKTLAFAMADPSYELPSIHPRSSGSLPLVEERLALIAFTLVCYHHTRPVTPSMRPVLLELLRDHAHHLTDAALGSRNGNHFQSNLHLLWEAARTSADTRSSLAASEVYAHLEGRGLVERRVQH